MAQETLDKIKESELAARQRIKEAQDESAGIISAAREEARQYRENVVSDARSTAKQTLERTKEAPAPP